MSGIIIEIRQSGWKLSDYIKIEIMETDDETRVSISNMRASGVFLEM
jgi:hypothetical protein